MRRDSSRRTRKIVYQKVPSSCSVRVADGVVLELGTPRGRVRDMVNDGGSRPYVRLGMVGLGGEPMIPLRRLEVATALSNDEGVNM